MHVLPGPAAVEYKGSRAVGDLTDEGKIVAEISGQTITFESPSAFRCVKEEGPLPVAGVPPCRQPITLGSPSAVRCLPQLVGALHHL